MSKEPEQSDIDKLRVAKERAEEILTGVQLEDGVWRWDELNNLELTNSKKEVENGK